MLSVCNVCAIWHKHFYRHKGEAVAIPPITSQPQAITPAAPLTYLTLHSIFFCLSLIIIFFPTSWWHHQENCHSRHSRQHWDTCSAWYRAERVYQRQLGPLVPQLSGAVTLCDYGICGIYQEFFKLLFILRCKNLLLKLWLLAERYW